MSAISLHCACACASRVAREQFLFRAKQRANWEFETRLKTVTLTQIKPDLSSIIPMPFEEEATQDFYCNVTLQLDTI